MSTKQPPDSPKPQSSILAGIVPEFPVGTVVVILNNVNTIPLEDRIGIVRECSLFSNSEKQYLAYNVELVSKPGVFRLRTKQFLKAANMPTKQPTPPPKFNIRDQVLYCNSRWRVIDRDYKSYGWLYKLEILATNKIICNTEAREKDLILASKSEFDPMYFTQAGPIPPAFVPGDFVLYNTFVCEVQSSVYDNKQSKYLYKISTYPGGHVYDFMLQESELKRYNFPSQESTTVVNEQGGKQSHLDARFDCIPSVVLRLLAQCLGFGARKYGKENWKNIPQWDHLNHAMNHINEWNRGNRDEPHLVNAMARLTFALWQAVDNNTQPDTYLHPDDTK